MSPERWQRIKQIFGDAMDLEPPEREAYIRAAAEDNQDLLSEVMRLLRESGRDSLLLSSPALLREHVHHANAEPHFSPSDLLADRFRVVRLIARGGMGDVYEAEDLTLHENVALKVIRPDFAAHQRALALFKREVQLARRVTHPNVCRIYDVAEHQRQDDEGRTQKITLLSMELLHGPTLAGYLREHGPMSPPKAQALIDQIASALQTAHDRGVVHRDLKPSNIILVPIGVTDSFRAVVTDFGLAHSIFREEEDRAGRGGTPAYVAPEQIQGGPVSTATDVYSFALVILETIGAWSPPAGASFDFESSGTVARSVLQAENSSLPPAWRAVLQRCLDKDPSRRYQRPADVAAALAAADRHRSRKMFTAAMGIAAIAVVFSVAAWFVFWRHAPEAHRAPTNRQVQVETDAESVWSVSPDGRFLAVTEWDTGDLAIREISSGNIQRLTQREVRWDRQPGGAYNVRFSPNGTRLVYAWHNSRDDAELRVIETNGTGEHIIYKDPSVILYQPADWSPDGSRILARLRRRDNTEQLAVLSLSSAQPWFPFPHNRIPAGRVLFSPDGDGIVFDAPQKTKEVAFDIHILTFKGVESALIESPANDILIAWSPDRRRLIFSSDRTGRLGLWMKRVSRGRSIGESRELRPDMGRIEPLGVTRSGSLFYALDDADIDVYTAVLDINAGRMLTPPARVMKRYIGAYEYPAWSPDGRQLVFGVHGSPEVGLYDVATHATRTVPVELVRFWRPQWRPSPLSVIGLGRDRSGREGHFAVDPGSGETRMIVSAESLGSGFEGVWSPDGAVLYDRFAFWKQGLFRFDISTGERRVLYVPREGIDIATENLALSPDGRTLAFHARNSAAGTASLMLLPTAGGEPRPLLTVTQPEAFLYGSFAWTPNGRDVLTARSRGMASELWRVPVNGGAPRKIDFPRMHIACLRLNRDGKTIAFMSRKTRSEIWALENFLP